MESMSRMPGIPGIDEGGSRFEQMIDGMRAVLERVAPTERVRQNGLCAYLDVAAGNEYGRYLK